MIGRSMQRVKVSCSGGVIGSENRKNKGCRDDRGSYALGDGLDSFGLKS